MMEDKLKIRCEIYCRPCGYFRPVNQYNPGKQEEFKDRKYYDFPDLLRVEGENEKD